MVYFLRKRLHISSVGHCGTLDPEAEGLLVMLLGEATKLSQYLLEKDKSYTLEAKFGLETASFDLDGQVLRDEVVNLKAEQIQAAVQKLEGERELRVPKFSAIKVKGEKLYDKARRGEDFEPPLKTMKFYNIQIKDMTSCTVNAQLSCSKGSYVRSWVSELGRELGTGATLTRLIRTESAPYSLSQATTTEELEAAALKGIVPEKGFIPLTMALPGWKTYRVNEQSEKLLKNGQISGDLKAQLIRTYRPGIDLGAQVLGGLDQMVAILGLEPGQGFVIRRVFRCDS
jgi:tRNA pseudouridine55 synthase